MTEHRSSQLQIPDEVLQTARGWNTDAYLSATLAPTARQGDLIAVAAFVGELERIRHTVGEPTLAQIRVQWWRDELQRMSRGGHSEHPVGKVLLATIIRHDLPGGLLTGIADAVADQVSGARFLDEHMLQIWLAKRHGAPIELAARCLGVAVDAAAVKQAGRACGLASLVMQSQRETDLDEVIGFALSETELITSARNAVERLAAILASKGRRARLPYLPASLVRIDLMNPADPAGRLRRLLRLSSAHWLGRF